MQCDFVFIKKRKEKKRNLDLEAHIYEWKGLCRWSKNARWQPKNTWASWSQERAVWTGLCYGPRESQPSWHLALGYLVLEPWNNPLLLSRSSALWYSWRHSLLQSDTDIQFPVQSFGLKMVTTVIINKFPGQQIESITSLTLGGELGGRLLDCSVLVILEPKILNTAGKSLERWITTRLPCANVRRDGLTKSRSLVFPSWLSVSVGFPHMPPYKIGASPPPYKPML